MRRRIMILRSVLPAIALGLLLGGGAVLGAAKLSCVFVDTSGEPLRDVEARVLPHDSKEEEKDGEEDTRYAKSDKEGRLEFEGLTPGKYLLQAQRKKHVPLEMAVEVPSDGPLQRALWRQKDFEKADQEARELLEQGRYEAAVEQLNKLREAYPRDAVLLDNLARAHAGLLHEDKALQYAEQAGKLNARFSSTTQDVRKTLLRGQGQQALKERDFDTAIEKFSALKKIAPDYVDAYHGLALAYGHQAKFEPALEAIDQALELQPGNEDLELIQRALKANAGIE